MQSSGKWGGSEIEVFGDEGVLLIIGEYCKEEKNDTTDGLIGAEGLFYRDIYRVPIGRYIIMRNLV